MQFFGVAEWRLGMGIAVDSTAFHELIAQVRGTAAALAGRAYHWLRLSFHQSKGGAADV